MSCVVRLLGLLAAVLLAGSPAAADQAPPLKLHLSIKIGAPAAKVWGLVGNFADESWYPGVTASTATDGNRPGSLRTVTLGDRKLAEMLRSYRADKMSLGYGATPAPENQQVLPVRGFGSFISVRSLPRGMTLVNWTARYRPLPGGPDADAAAGLVSRFLQAGLDNLKRVAETQ